MPLSDLNVLLRELAEVREWRDELLVRLNHSVAELRETGRALPAELLHSAREYRRRYDSFELDLLAIPEFQQQPPESSLQAWEAALERVARQRRVAGLCEEMRQIEFHGVDAGGLLAKIQTDVDQLQISAELDESIAQEILCDQHPFHALLKLLRRGNDLADQEWTELQDRVTARYGREVSTAVARGRLRWNAFSEQTAEVLS